MLPTGEILQSTRHFLVAIQLPIRMDIMCKQTFNRPLRPSSSEHEHLHKNVVKIGREVPKILSRTDNNVHTHTHTHTHRQARSSQYSAPLLGRSNNHNITCCYSRLVAGGRIAAGLLRITVRISTAGMSVYARELPPLHSAPYRAEIRTGSPSNRWFLGSP